MIGQGGNRLVATAPWLLAAALCAPSCLAAGTPPAPLFQDQKPLEMTLELPLKTLLRERKERPEVDGVAVVPGPAGTPTRLDVKVSTRGHNRLEKCSFPPLGLNFRRSQLDGTVFAGQDKLKLATMCRGGGDYDQYLELERLVYLLYQQVADVSLQVRPLRMRYVDTDKDGEVTEAPAFFLEHFDSLAARTGRVVLDVPTVPLDDLDPATLALIGLFEYLVGNTDWAATSAAAGRDCCHNIVPLVPASGAGPVVPFPYDFDSSGFVDAPYAEPSEVLNTRSVRERVYRGYCVSNPHLEEIRAKLNAARPAMESIIQAGQLTPRTRRKALDYLAEGFEDINDPKNWQRRILDRCRGG
jgi:hypothetical protein